VDIQDEPLAEQCAHPKERWQAKPKSAHISAEGDTTTARMIITKDDKTLEGSIQHNEPPSSCIAVGLGRVTQADAMTPMWCECDRSQPLERWDGVDHTSKSRSQLLNFLQHSASSPGTHSQRRRLQGRSSMWLVAISTPRQKFPNRERTRSFFSPAQREALAVNWSWKKRQDARSGPVQGLWGLLAEYFVTNTVEGLRFLDALSGFSHQTSHPRSRPAPLRVLGVLRSPKYLVKKDDPNTVQLAEELVAPSRGPGRQAQWAPVRHLHHTPLQSNPGLS
jgi:hypothetical protein